MKLLIRPPPVVGESWPGYLLRLSEKNHYSGLHDFAALLTMTPQELVCAKPAGILKDLGIEIPLDISNAFAKTKDRKLSLLSAGRTLLNKICSLCLKETRSKYLKSSWDRALSFVCASHQVYLIDTCPECHKPLSYLRRQIGACHCGFELGEAIAEPVQTDVHQLYAVLEINSGSAADHPTFGFSTAHEVSAAALIRRLVQLESTSESTAGFIQGSTIQAFASVRECREALPWFERWPSSFIERTVAAKGTRTGHRTALIFGQTSAAGLRFPQILNALRDYSRCVLNSTPTCHSRFRIFERGGDHLRECFELTSSQHSFNLIKYWVSQGWLSRLQAMPSSNGILNYEIRHEQGFKAIHLMHASALASAVSESKNIDVKVLLALTTSGCLVRVAPDFGDFLLWPPQVSELIAHLGRLASPSNEKLDAVARLDQVLLFLNRRLPLAMRSFMECVLRGAVPLHIACSSHRNLSDLRVQPRDLRRWVIWGV